jgi:hypothetical protein
MILRVLATLLVPFLAAPLLAQAANKVDFQKQIWPILEKRCLECHSTAKAGPDGRMKKPKGGVTLDSKDGITTGKGGKLVIAKKPEDSLIYKSTTLPADDEDRMPSAKAKNNTPLPKEQTDLIKLWIEQGADFGTWTGKAKEAGDDKGKTEKSGEKGEEKEKPGSKTGEKPGEKSGEKPKEKPKGGESPLVALQKGVKPLPPETLAPFAKGPFQIASVGDDSPLLQVSCAGFTDTVDDHAVDELLPLADHIAYLDLARTKITDAAGATLAKMPRLVNLDVRQTNIGNHGIAQLAACKELRSLNLFGTKAGDYAVSALASCKHLEELYLWQTEVSAAAVVRLKESMPETKVVVAADLPEPLAEGAGGGARRRPGK